MEYEAVVGSELAAAAAAACMLIGVRGVYIDGKVCDCFSGWLNMGLAYRAGKYNKHKLSWYRVYVFSFSVIYNVLCKNR